MSYTKHRHHAIGEMQARAVTLVSLCEKALGSEFDRLPACTPDAELAKAVLKAIVSHDADLLRRFRADIAADVAELPYTMVHFHDDRWDEGTWHRDAADPARQMHWLPLRHQSESISFLPDVPFDLTRVLARGVAAAGIKRVTTPVLAADEFLTWPSTTYHRGTLNRDGRARINYIVTVVAGADGKAVTAQTPELTDDEIAGYCRKAHGLLASIAAGEAASLANLDTRQQILFRTSLHALTLKEARLGTEVFSAALTAMDAGAQRAA